MEKAVKACRPAFLQQISARPATAPVLTLGKWAAATFRDRYEKLGHRGFIREQAGRKFIQTWHPTFAIFYNPFEWGAFSIDVDRFARLIRGQLRPGPSALLTKPTVLDLREVFKSWHGHGTVDIETAPQTWDQPWTGKDPTRARIRTIGLGNPEWGVSFEASRSALMDEAKRLIAKYLTVWQNGPWFDHRVLRRYGFKIGRWHDIRDMRRAQSSTSRLSLAYMTSIFDDAPPWKEEDDDEGEGGKLVFTRDMEKLKLYNAEDTVRTARCFEGITSDAEWGTPRVETLYKMHRKLAIIAAEMHTVGMEVDEPRKQKLDGELVTTYREREAKFLAAVGIKGMRCNPNDMRSLIFQRHANARVSRFNLPDPIDPKMWNDAGTTIKVDQGSLLLLITDPTCPPDLKELVKLYWEAMSVAKARSTFVVSDLVTQAIGPDGRLRAGWNSCGTDTGRFSCSEPNLMNLSKEKEG